MCKNSLCGEIKAVTICNGERDPFVGRKRGPSCSQVADKHKLSLRDVPKPNPGIARDGFQPAARPIDRAGKDLGRMLESRRRRITGIGKPDASRPVPEPGEEHFAIRGKLETSDLLPVIDGADGGPAPGSQMRIFEKSASNNRSGPR